jgi:hypothetical protein
MRNLRPTEYAAAAPEWITAPFSFTPDFPFPQIVRGENITLLFDETAVSIVAGDWSVSALTPKLSDDRGTGASITGSGRWHAATFEDVWFATNGTTLVFQMPAYDEVLVANGVTVETLCGHNDRLILAGLSGDWFSSESWQELFKRWRETQPQFSHDQQEWSPRWGIWGERLAGGKDIPFWTMLAALGLFGQVAFDSIKGELLTRIERGELGFFSIRSLGTPVFAGGFGPDVMLYSQEARVALRPMESAPTYLVMNAGPAGAAHRGIVSGDAREHCWYAPDGELYRHPAGGAAEHIRFSEIFGSLSGVVASFDDIEREHWFADTDDAYVLTRFGMGGPMSQRPMALARANGVLIGPALGLGLSTVPVAMYSHLVDMRRRGSKRVQELEVVLDGLASPWGDVKAGSPAFSTGTVPLNDLGVGYPVRSGNQFYIGAGGTGTVGQDYSIQRVDVRYQAESRAHQRGGTSSAGNT